MTTSNPLKIVVIEDHDALRDATVEFLRSRGFHVSGLPDAESVADELRDVRPDLYVIDLNLPGEDGLSLTKRIRTRSPNIRIIITTARDQLHDRIKGYESGADLYLTKPFHREELLAAIDSMAKRIESSKSDDRITLNTSRLKLSGKYTEVDVSKHEALLLASMLRSTNHSLERWQINQVLKGSTEELSTAGLEMRIGRLRRKLEKAGAGLDTIKSVYGRGYVLCVDLEIV